MPKKKSPPAYTDDARRNQLINLAYDLAEQRLRDGTATSQEVTTFLKMGTEQSRLQLDILRAERELMEAKRDAIRADARNDELSIQVINAMRRYNGEDEEYDGDVYGGYPPSNF